MDYSSVLVLVCVVLQIFVQHAEALDCGPGTFNSGTSCDPCDIGEYQALSFQTDCDSCVAGQTTMATGSTSSTDCIADCTAGTYRAADESGCLPCPENTYQPDTLQTDCIRCPVNLLAPPGSDNLVDCVGRCPTDMDIVFLVDASTSISYAEFNFVIIFLINTISNFVVGSDATRVGIIEFADDVLLSPRLDLVGSTDREVAIQAASTLIQGVVPGTNTAAGFQAANQMLANQGRVGIAHHIIVITDGKSDNFLQTVQQANEAKMSFRYITSIGVGDKIFERGLREIATDDSSFIKVDSFFSLLTTDILDDICIDTFSCLEQMDLYIIRHVDSAENGNIDAFLTSLQDSYTSVNTVDVDSGAANNKLTADLAAVSTGGSSRAKVVVIFTDKPTAETGVDAAAQSLMDAGYVISVIYIDVATADSSSFDGIRTSESLMFQTEYFYQLPYNQFIIRSLCIEPPANPCNPNPCLNGGTCIITSGDYYCSCPKWHSGQHCESSVDCGPGTFNSGTSCDPCDLGKYQALSFQTDCDSCVAGQTTMATGSTSSTDCIADCTAGTYRAADESGCLPCPENTYQPDTLQTDCIRCPVNLLAPPGSDNLVDCVGRCPTDMDIVFLVDASTSISYAEFNFVIIFLINTISNFVVGSDATRVGIIEFADDVLLSPRLDLVGSTDREVAIQAASTLIQGVVPGTNTAAGFQAANQMLANQGRVGIAHHIIVITDGKSDNFLQTVQQANEAKMSFRYITSIGVGDKIFERGLREIATDDSSFIKVDSFFSLLTTDILDDICIDTFSCLEQMDLYIIRHVDSAENGNIDAFLTSLQDSYTSVNTVDVDSGASTDKLTADLAAVGTGGSSRAKVVVIFTDKPTTENGVDAAAQSLMDAGYVISVIYIDVAAADSSSFDGIRTSESLIFQTENFYQLPTNQFIIRSLCIAPGFNRNTK